MPITRTRRRLLAAIIAVAALSAGACSSSDDDEGSSPTTAETAPAPSTTVAGVSVTSDDGSFRAEFPVRPDRSEANETASGVDLVIVSYVAEIDDGAVGVSYSDYPGVPEDPQPVLDGAAEGSATRTGGTITDSSDLTYLGRPAKDVEIAVTGGTLFERVVLDDERIYIILGAGERGRLPEYDRLLDTFELL